VTMACSIPDFYEAVGHGIDPRRLQIEEARLAMRAGHAIADEAGSGPASLLEVIRWLKQPHRNLHVTRTEMWAVNDMFDAAEDFGFQPVAVFARVVAMLLREAIRSSYDGPPGTRAQRGSKSNRTTVGAAGGQE
jgi:hypothetical protein